VSLTNLIFAWHDIAFCAESAVKLQRTNPSFCQLC